MSTPREYAESDLVEAEVNDRGDIRKGFFYNGVLVRGTTYFCKTGDTYEGEWNIAGKFLRGTVSSKRRVAKGEWGDCAYMVSGTVTYPSGEVRKGNWSKHGFSGTIMKKTGDYTDWKKYENDKMTHHMIVMGNVECPFM